MGLASAVNGSGNVVLENVNLTGTAKANVLTLNGRNVITGGVNFSDLRYVITPATEEVAEVAIKYGAFIQNIVDFLLIAMVVFMMVKMINKMRDAAQKKEEAPREPVAPPPTPEDILLLREIRDSLKK